MSRPTRTIIALDPNDKQRFARTLMAQGDRSVFIEDMRSWPEIWRIARHGAQTLMIIGARPPDKAALRRLGGYVDTFVILQHAVRGPFAAHCASVCAA